MLSRVYHTTATIFTTLKDGAGSAKKKASDFLPTPKFYWDGVGVGPISFRLSNLSNKLVFALGFTLKAITPAMAADFTDTYYSASETTYKVSIDSDVAKYKAYAGLSHDFLKCHVTGNSSVIPVAFRELLDRRNVILSQGLDQPVNETVQFCMEKSIIEADFQTLLSQFHLLAFVGLAINLLMFADIIYRSYKEKKQSAPAADSGANVLRESEPLVNEAGSGSRRLSLYSSIFTGKRHISSTAEKEENSSTVSLRSV